MRRRSDRDGHAWPAWLPAPRAGQRRGTRRTRRALRGAADSIGRAATRGRRDRDRITLRAKGAPMSYKTLLVHLDDSRHRAARMAVALDLARRFDAHLIGLYVVSQDLFQPLFKLDDSLRLSTLEEQHVQ